MKKVPGPRVMLYDLETSPLLGFAWEVWDTNIIEVVEHSYILSIAYKWLDEDKVHVLALPDYKTYKKRKNDDGELVEAFHKILETADIIIAHNGDGFDWKKLQARFIGNGLHPTKPLKMVDTLKAARRGFKFASNKLDDLGKTLGVGRKLPHTGKHLWFGCMDGDMKSWALMKKYNKQDVVLLEAVYKKLLPYIPNHPNRNIYTRETACPACGSFDIQHRGFRHGLNWEAKAFYCHSCGKHSQGPREAISRVQIR